MTALLLAVTEASSPTVSSVLLGAIGLALGGGVVAFVQARVSRKTADQTAAGTLASGAAELTDAALSLVKTTTDAATKLAAGLEAERDACHKDRIVLLSVVEGHSIDDRDLAALRARIVA